MKIRIATYNIWGNHEAWAVRQPVLKAALRQLQPDLIAFQEAVVRPGEDQVADLLGPDYQVIHLAGRSADGVGASIASRWPVGTLREAGLHLTPRIDPRAGWIGRVTALEIQAPEPFNPLLFVHHKPAWQLGFERERELQAVAAARFIEEVTGPRKIHVVLAGDFDAAPESASLRFWRGLQSLEGMSVHYTDAWERLHPDDPGHTFSPTNPWVRAGEMPLESGRRIDYILVRGDAYGPTLRVIHCDRILAQPAGGVWTSDHFGVFADFEAV